MTELVFSPWGFSWLLMIVHSLTFRTRRRAAPCRTKGRFASLFASGLFLLIDRGFRSTKIPMSRQGPSWTIRRGLGHGHCMDDAWNDSGGARVRIGSLLGREKSWNDSGSEEELVRRVGQRKYQSSCSGRIVCPGKQRLRPASSLRRLRRSLRPDPAQRPATTA